MKRYKIQTNYILNCTANMIEQDSGEWIRYSDYVKEKEEWSNEVEIDYENDELYKRLRERFNL